MRLHVKLSALLVTGAGLSPAEKPWTTRKRIAMKIKMAALILALATLLPALASASPSPKATAVLETERSWLKALTMHDTNTLQKLLAQNYVHVDSSGRLYHRDDEITAVKTMGPIHEAWGQQTVDFAGTAAIVHGISTSVQNGKTVLERYVDIYQFTNNRWRAISAQETLIK
jgi:uncharacterized protein DUF4440